MTSLTNFPRSSVPESLLPSDILSQFSCLRDLVESASLNPEEKEDYMSTISSLELSSKHMMAAGLRLEIGMALFWPYMIPKSMMRAIYNREPLALILLAHFCVLLSFFEHQWITKGWARQVLADIIPSIPSSYASWLNWPREHVWKSR